MFKSNPKWGPLLHVFNCIALSYCVFYNDELVFIVEPGPSLLRAPVFTEVLLNCAVNRDYFHVEWKVQPPRASELVVNSQQAIQRLRALGIRVRPSSLHTATSALVFVNGTTNNNRTLVTCSAVLKSDPTQKFLSEVEVIIYYPPVSVSHVVIVNNKINSLNISWTASTGVGALVYSLTATNLNVSVRPITVTDLTTSRYTLTVPTLTACDTYSFQVFAVSYANVRASSKKITAVIPSVPNILIVQESTSHFVTISDGVATLTVSFNAKNPCPTEPILKFNLFLGLESEKQLLLEKSVHPDPTVDPSADSKLTVMVEGLQQNTYWFYIVATNRHGNSRPTAKIFIVASQLQEITICRVEGSQHNYIIHCEFLQDSTASGCDFALMVPVEEARSTKRVDSFDGTIPRSRSDSIRVEIRKISDYTELQGYAIQKDRRVDGSLVKRNLSNIEFCKPIKLSLPLSNLQFFLVLVGLLAGLVVFIALLWLLYCVVFERDWLRYRCRRQYCTQLLCNLHVHRCNCNCKCPDCRGWLCKRCCSEDDSVYFSGDDTDDMGEDQDDQYYSQDQNDDDQNDDDQDDQDQYYNNQYDQSHYYDQIRESFQSVYSNFY